ncbi:DNA internalization-related competence protein ComEC/Rec2 [Salinibacter altiplanensis]|uniref:DNA internalization-related competence protein ComEC/Rec2 n=1 Tax=Salinibacter altiplanensis TaxID=1803181 RepID=UPI000C9EEDD3|nr:DNA internalization-related competence protein ComEC/Rec2 [Salinibacter altiplanensis]
MRSDSSIQWSAYPALCVAGAFALGIVGASRLVAASFFLWLGGVGGGLALFVGMQWWDRTRLVTLAPLGRTFAVMLVMCAAGGARHAAYEARSPRGLAPAAEKSRNAVSVQGAITNAPQQTEEATRFVLETDTLFGPRDTAAVDGQVRATLKPSPWANAAPSFPKLHQGDMVRLHGSLRRPSGRRNPGGFDYSAYLSRRGICCTLYVDAPDHVIVLGNRRGALQDALVSVRGHIRRQIARYVPSGEGRAVLRALLLGDRSRITDAQRDRFAKTGLMHLLAVSGLHVFLVGMVLYTLLRPFLMRFRLRWRTVEVVRAVVTVFVLIIYMLLTGGRPSVVRAVVMATLFIGGIFFQRSAHPLNTLGSAALVLLAVRPPMLFDAGFQLSMAAVAGIVALNPRFREGVPERYRNSASLDWLVSTGTASAAAILGTAPVLLYHFGWVSAAGLFLNMIGIPCTGLALTSAIVTVTMGGLWTAAAASFGSAADLFLQGLLATSRYGADWFSWAGIRMSTPDFWKLGALGAGLVAIAQWPRPRLRWRWVIASSLFLTVAVWGSVVGPGARPTLDLVFFDVGQGDAALLKTPSGRHVLVDTGPRSPSGAAAEFTVLPFLEQQGIQRLDLVVVSHSDQDHLGGVPTLLREVQVGRLVHNGYPVDTELYDETRRLLDQEDIPHQAARRGDTLRLGASVRARVLSPPAHDNFGGENDASVVLRVQYGRVDVLLPGDIERLAEQDLVRTYGENLGGHVVKVPHHGSETSSHPEFVHLVGDPERTHAVVSTGRSTQYDMPSEKVIRRWQERSEQVHSISKKGAVWIRTDGKEVWQARWK